MDNTGQEHAKGKFRTLEENAGRRGEEEGMQQEEEVNSEEVEVSKIIKKYFNSSNQKSRTMKETRFIYSFLAHFWKRLPYRFSVNICLLRKW